MTPNKIAAEMDAHLEAHPPNIVWGKAVKGVRHHESIEEVPLPKPKPKKAPGLSVDDLIAAGSLDTPEPRYMETLDEDERTGH